MILLIQDDTQAQCKQNFYLYKALNGGTIDVCDNISDVSRKSECKNLVIGIQSIETQDVSVCEALEWKDKNMCMYATIQSIALSQWDESICEDIDDENFKNICIDSVQIPSIE